MKSFWIFLAVAACQWAFASRGLLFGGAADLPLAFALYLGLRDQQGVGGWRLWALGLFVDVLGPWPTGLHALTFLCLGSIAGGFARRFTPDATSVRLFLLGLSTLFLKVIQTFSLYLEIAAPGPAASVAAGVSAAGLTTLAGMALFAVLDRLYDREIRAARTSFAF